MSSIYPKLPDLNANMSGIIAFRKELERSTRDVFQAWTDFTAANAELEKAAVRDVVSEADDQNKEFRASLRLFKPPEDKPNDSFFTCMIPVLQQVQYKEQPTGVDGVRALLASLIGELREEVVDESAYGTLKRWVQQAWSLEAAETQQPWQLYLALCLQNGEEVRAPIKEELVEFVKTEQHRANIMTLRLFSEALQVKFLILSDAMTDPTAADTAIFEQAGFYLTCLGGTHTAAQKYVLLHYDAARQYYAVFYAFQAGGSRRYVFELNRLPAKLINAYMQLCERTDEMTEYERVAPQLLLATSTRQAWAAAAGTQ